MVAITGRGYGHSAASAFGESGHIIPGGLVIHITTTISSDSLLSKASLGANHRQGTGQTGEVQNLRHISHLDNHN